MAVQTKQYARLSAGGSLVLLVFMEYEDTDYQIINDDGDPDDFRVIRWFGTNYSEFDRTIELQKGNGQAWKSATLPAGESFSVDAGGAVKYESDIPVWRYT